MEKINFIVRHLTGSLAGMVALMSIPLGISAQPYIYVKTAISEDLTAPIHMTHAGDASDRIFVAERAGVIKVFSSSYAYIGVYLDISSRVSTAVEGALLSIAFHPNFSSNGCFFVHFTDTNGNIVISRYDASTPSANTMDDTSPVDVLTVPHPNTNHYGGEMHFSSDGDLYVSVGDGGGSNDLNNNAQNLESWLGKILRITPATSGTATYTIPADNPFPTNTTLARNEIYAIGLRNPFRWEFDSDNGDVWIGDVGQGAREEIDYVAAASFKGANFAWRCYEGSIRTPAYAGSTYDTECGSYSNFLPRYDYARASGSVSVVGGIIYRGSKYPQMDGYYIGSDFYTGAYHVLAPSASSLSSMPGLTTKTGITDFAVSEDGDIFAVSMNENAIFRFVDATVEPLPVTLVDFRGRVSPEGIRLSWKTTMEEDFSHFEVEHSTDARHFLKLGFVEGSKLDTGAEYQFVHTGATLDDHYYRLKMLDVDESFKYSRIIHVEAEGSSISFVNPSVITGGTMSIDLAETGRALEVVNSAGNVMMTTNLADRNGRVYVPVDHLGAGLYIARLRAANLPDVQQKVMIVP